MISQRRRSAGEAINNRSMLEEVRDRDDTVKKLQRKKKILGNSGVIKSSTVCESNILEPQVQGQVITDVESESITEVEIEASKPKKPVPYVRVYDYEECKWKADLL